MEVVNGFVKWNYETDRYNIGGYDLHSGDFVDLWDNWSLRWICGRIEFKDGRYVLLTIDKEIREISLNQKARFYNIMY